MRVNRNKEKCLLGVDERTPDVYMAVTASYCLRLSALKTKETIPRKYVGLHLNAIKTESNLMLKDKYRKETQEEMKSERESPLEKSNKDIPLPHAFPYLMLFAEHRFCTCEPPCRLYHILQDVISDLRRTIGTEGPILLLSIPCTAASLQLLRCHYHFHQALAGSTIMAALE